MPCVMMHKPQTACKTRPRTPSLKFYVNFAPGQYRYKAPYKANILPENPDTTGSSEAPRQNPHALIVVRPTTPLGAAFTSRMVRNHHGAGLLEARRLANPCVARTSGAPSCALFHSPDPGRVNYYWSFSLTSIGSRSRWFTQGNLSDLRSGGTPRPRGLR